MVNCWVLLPEQWWQADAAGRLLSSSQQAATALWPEYLASLHLALSFVRLIHQQAFTQPVETADSRRQWRYPECQSHRHLCRAQVHLPFLISVCQEWNGGWRRYLSPGGELQAWALFHFPREFSVFVNGFYFLLNIHLTPPPPPRNCFPAIVSVEYFFYLLLYIFLYIYLFTYTFIFSTLYISYMCILLCLYTESMFTLQKWNQYIVF